MYLVSDGFKYNPIESYDFHTLKIKYVFQYTSTDSKLIQHYHHHQEVYIGLSKLLT